MSLNSVSMTLCVARTRTDFGNHGGRNLDTNLPSTMIDSRNDAKDIAERFASVVPDARVPNSLQHHSDMTPSQQCQSTEGSAHNEAEE